MLAYIQIALESAKENQIYDALCSMNEVSEVHMLFGEWDIIVKLELESPEALSAFVISKVRTIPGVRLTSTMIVAK